LLAYAALLFLGAASFTAPATAQAPSAGPIKIGVLYDHTGPFAEGGAVNCRRGAKMIIDFLNEQGGVLGKYKIVQVDGDSQSKGDVALNEAERLLNVENPGSSTAGTTNTYSDPNPPGTRTESCPSSTSPTMRRNAFAAECAPACCAATSGGLAPTPSPRAGGDNTGASWPTASGWSATSLPR
jgi:hypothetical protein